MRSLLFYFLLFFPTIVRGQAPVAVCTNFHCGFFSAFNMVVGLLDAYEKGEISGIEIKLGTTGLYYDKTKGPSWWEYYFETLPIQVSNTAPRIHIDEGLYFSYSLRGHIGISRERGYYLVNKYIKIRPKFLKEVDTFLERKIKNRPFVSVHYRGTDKMEKESNIISREEVILQIKQKLFQMEKFKKTDIFVATDDQPFLDLMKQEFGNRVCYFEMERSTDNQPIHEHREDGYISGKMALLDCLVLSRSDLFFRTSSNLGGVAIILNLSLPSLLLNRACWGNDRED